MRTALLAAAMARWYSDASALAEGSAAGSAARAVLARTTNSRQKMLEINGDKARFCMGHSLGSNGSGEVNEEGLRRIPAAAEFRQSIHPDEEFLPGEIPVCMPILLGILVMGDGADPLGDSPSPHLISKMFQLNEKTVTPAGNAGVQDTGCNRIRPPGHWIPAIPAGMTC
jgi:hypothetical protein